MNPEITLLVHNIRSTHNVGAIFRTAEGFGVKKIILSGYTPYPELSLCSKAPVCALVDGEIRSEDPRLPHIREKITSQRKSANRKLANYRAGAIKRQRDVARISAA